MDPKPRAGWGAAVALAAAATALEVIGSGLLIFLSLSLFLLALPPRRPRMVAVAVGLAWFVMIGTDQAMRSLWYIERGWALLLAAWFILLVVARPAWRFMPRALGALGATLATVAVVLAISPGGLASAESAVMGRFAHIVDAFLAQAGESGMDTEWWSAVFARVREVRQELYPALLGLESLAALGVAWWGYTRFGAGEGSPLGALRDFRFCDHLIWILIAGLFLVVTPLGDAAVRAGANLVVFMGALYALRGFAILLVVFGLEGVWGAIVTALLFLLLYPIVLTTSILVGLSDTWIDLRARRRAARTDS